MGLCQNNPQAADALGEVRNALAAGENLDPVIAAVKNKVGVIPPDAMGAKASGAAGAAEAWAAAVAAGDKPAMALSIGVAYLAAGQCHRANTVFDLVGGASARPADKANNLPPIPARPSMPGATQAQLAFAHFGKGAYLQSQGVVAPATEPFTASIKTYPEGTWHDETLYRLALLTQAQVHLRPAPAAPAAPAPKPPAPVARPATPTTNPGGAASKPAVPLDKDGKPIVWFPPDYTAAVKAGKERFAAVQEARALALPYWQELVKRYPKSPRHEQALYDAGATLHEMAKTALAGRADRLLQQAASTLKQFCELYPKSLSAGDAYVRQLDIALEETFDMKLAVTLSEQAVQWAKSQPVRITTESNGTLTKEALADAAKAVKEAVVVLPPWYMLISPSPRAILDDLYNLYLRAGIVAYLQEKYDEAAKLLEASGPARPAEGTGGGGFDLQKLGLFNLIRCCGRKEPAWHAEAIALATSDTQKMALKLADTYLFGQRAEKAETVYQRILDGEPALGPRTLAVDGYCFMKLAQAYSKQKIQYEKSIEYYKRFYKKEYADLPWAANAIMRLAVLEYNTSPDPARSISRCQHIIATYPNHPEAERAMYFLATDAVRLRDKALAASTCKTFLEKYPSSGWRAHIQKLLTDDIPSLNDKINKKGYGS